MLSAAPASAVTPDVQVQFRMELTDASGAPVRAVEAGDEFLVNVYVADERQRPQGVFAAYLDLVFDQSLVERTGQVTFGESYTNALVSGGMTPGVIDEVGAMTSLFGAKLESAAEPNSLLFRAPFRAINTGPVTFFAEAADRFPASYVLLFGVNEPIELADIRFDSKTLDIVQHAAPTTSFPIIDVATLQSDLTVASLLRSATPAAAEFESSRLDATQATERNRPLADSFPLLSTREADSAISSNDRVMEIAPRASSPERSPLAVDESNWIELPYQLFSNERPHSTTESSYRELFLQQSKTRREDPPTYDSQSKTSSRQRDGLGQRRTKAFLRMNWADQERTSFESHELLAARMIDIDAIFANAESFDLPESDSAELLADIVDTESKDLRTDDGVDSFPGRSQIRAARTSSLAVDVGVSKDRSVPDHSKTSEVNADSTPAEAGPPKPHSNRKEAAQDPA